MSYPAIFTLFLGESKRTYIFPKHQFCQPEKWLALGVCMSRCAPHFVTLQKKDKANKITIFWLLRFRWASVAIQVLLLYVATNIFGMAISFPFCLSLIAAILVSNIILYFLSRQGVDIPCHVPTLLMTADVFLLTLLFNEIDCAMNPFTILYLIYAVIGGVLLQRWCAYGLTLFAIGCYASFFFIADPRIIDQQTLSAFEKSEPFIQAQHSIVFSTFTRMIESNLITHSYLTFMVFSVATVLVGVIVIRIMEAIKTQREMIGKLEEDRRQNEKLTSLAAFAAGAAHEFSTPLATIAIASGEMLHHFKKHGGEQDIIDDTRLIREQVDRCKEILFQISAGAGEHLGEADELVSLADMTREIVTVMNLEHRCNIQFINNVKGLSVTMPLRIFRRTMRGLLKNAIDATPHADMGITLTCSHDDTHIYFEVCDLGIGMDEKSVQRATEPFYTSKEPGEGMGLGLYLTKMIARRFNGDFRLTSTPGEGTTALLFFAKEKLEPILYKETV